MSWLEQKIRRYEHARWTTDDNRRVFPFEWGLEHIGGRRDEPDPRDLLRPFPADLMRMWPISTRVNKPENDDPSIVEPIELATAVASATSS